MRRANVEVRLASHPYDDGPHRVGLLRHQPPGAANPFLLGVPRTQRFMAVMDAMPRGRIADAESAPAQRTAASHACR